MRYSRWTASLYSTAPHVRWRWVVRPVGQFGPAYFSRGSYATMAAANRAAKRKIETLEARA